LTIHVYEAEKLSLLQIQAFLSASETIRFQGETQTQIYHWIEQVLGRTEPISRSTYGFCQSDRGAEITAPVPKPFVMWPSSTIP
jgi:hypothetical protein